jgi:transposase
LTEAYGVSVRSLVAVLTTVVAQAATVEAEVERCFGQHPNAEIITSQPGLGVILGARVLAEFGDDKHRFLDAKARRNYAGTSPITKTSGTRRVVLARYARNRRLADALHQQAFAALNASPGARRHPPPSTPGASQPPRRHPRPLSTSSRQLRRSHRLGAPRDRRRLTT